MRCVFWPDHPQIIRPNNSSPDARCAPVLRFRQRAMAHDGGRRQRRNEESTRTEGTATRRRYGGISDGLDERTAGRRVFRRGRALTADRRERAAAEISKHPAQPTGRTVPDPAGPGPRSGSSVRLPPADTESAGSDLAGTRCHGDEVQGDNPRLHRSASRISDDVRSAEDRRHLEVREPSNALLLRRLDI